MAFMGVAVGYIIRHFASDWRALRRGTPRGSGDCFHGVCGCAFSSIAWWKFVLYHGGKCALAGRHQHALAGAAPHFFVDLCINVLIGCGAGTASTRPCHMDAAISCGVLDEYARQF